jgi:hypothetical protein
MKKSFAFFAIIIIISFFSCEKDNNTDTDIDKNYQEVKFLNSNQFNIIATGYNGGYDPGNIGTNLNGIVFKIIVENSSASDKQVNFHYGGTSSEANRQCSMMVSPGESYIQNVFFRVINGDENDRLFIGSDNDISDITIKVEGMYYIEDIKENQEIKFINSNPFTIATAGYNSGYDAGNLGTNLNGIVFKIIVENSSVSEKQVNFHYGGTSSEANRQCSMMVSPGESYIQNVFFRVDNGDENDRLFIGSDNDISDITIKVEGMYYIEDIKDNQEIKFINSNPFTIATAGYNSGYDAENLGTNLNGIVFKIIIENSTVSDKQVNFHYGDTSSEANRQYSMMVSAGETYIQNAFFRVDNSDENDRLFIGSDNDISGLTIKVEGMYYIEN